MLEYKDTNRILFFQFCTSVNRCYHSLQLLAQHLTHSRHSRNISCFVSKWLHENKSEQHVKSKVFTIWRGLSHTCFPLACPSNDIGQDCHYYSQEETGAFECKISTSNHRVTESPLQSWVQSLGSVKNQTLSIVKTISKSKCLLLLRLVHFSVRKG